MSDDMINSMHTKPVTSVDQWRAPLRLFNKGSKKVRLWIVESFDTAFGDNAAVVCLQDIIFSNHRLALPRG